MLEILRNHSNIAIPISLLISIGISLAGVLPSLFVTGANIIFFGPFYGFLISLLGETIGAYITLTVYRLGLKKSIDKLAGRYKLIDNIADSRGKKAALLIFEGRLIPFIPSGFVTLAASISRVKPLPFTIATFFGKAPSIAIEALVSYDMINISDNWLRLIITVVSLTLAAVTIKRDKRK